MATVNQAQRENWESIAGPKWLRNEAELEASHARITPLLLAAANPAHGMAVLEVGCGTGTLLPHWAERVGPTGRVTGLDISATMLGLARSRVPASITLIEADAQTTPFEPVFDRVVSKFGVMFFDDPVAAFTNLRGALRPGGRLCFICWATLAENLHWRLAVEIATRHLGPPTPKPPHAPGPMGLADAEYVRGLLRAAGYADVTVETAHPDLPSGTLEAAVGIAMSMGPGGALISERAPDATVLAMIRDELTAAFGPYQRDGIVHLPAAVHVVTATAPGGSGQPEQPV